jgi:hypothetical protein
MSSESPFQPRRGANQKVTATTASQTIVCGKGNHAIRIVNQGAVLGYFVTFSSTDEPGKVCTVNETPVAVSGGAGSVLVIEKPLEYDSIAYLADSTTTIMHFQPGEAAA